MELHRPRPSHRLVERKQAPAAARQGPLVTEKRDRYRSVPANRRQACSLMLPSTPRQGSTARSISQPAGGRPWPGPRAAARTQRRTGRPNQIPPAKRGAMTQEELMCQNQGLKQRSRDRPPPSHTCHARHADSCPLAETTLSKNLSLASQARPRGLIRSVCRTQTTSPLISALPTTKPMPPGSRGLWLSPGRSRTKDEGEQTVLPRAALQRWMPNMSETLEDSHERAPIFGRLRNA